MQAALNESLPEAADRRLVGHHFVLIQLEELLKAQAVVDLDFGLRVAQAVEMLQDHHAQQHPNAGGGTSAVAVGGRHACLRLAEIHFAGNGFKHTVGRAALLHSQIKKRRLVVSQGLHGSQNTSLLPTFKHNYRLLQRFLKGLAPSCKPAQVIQPFQLLKRLDDNPA